MVFLVFLVGFLSFLGISNAGNRCAIAVGQLNCSSDQQWARDVEVSLMDDDGLFNNDDRMGVTRSDKRGFFRVEGCGYDFGTDPDPYVRIRTYCNAPDGKVIKTAVAYKFAPDMIDYGEIGLDVSANVATSEESALLNLMQNTLLNDSKKKSIDKIGDKKNQSIPTLRPDDID